MGYIFIDREGDGDMRQNMRSRMRGGSYRHVGYSPMMRNEGSYEHGYRMGYKHGWEDSEDDMDGMEMRRRRNSRGEFI